MSGNLFRTPLIFTGTGEELLEIQLDLLRSFFNWREFKIVAHILAHITHTHLTYAHTSHTHTTHTLTHLTHAHTSHTHTHTHTHHKRTHISHAHT